MTRRDLLFLAALAPLRGQARNLRITKLETFVVKVSARGNWIFVRLGTDQGLTGLGEASHGMGFQRAQGEERMEALLGEYFEMVRGESPFDVQQYRQRGRAKARAGKLPSATAFSAIEQALWDLCGKAAGIPACDLLGGRLRPDLLVYANINRATNDRTPAGFAANAAKAVEQGDRKSVV